MTRPTDRRSIAFVLGMGANGLGVARCLGREGIPVVGMDSMQNAPGLQSRYCKGLVTPRLSKDPQATLGLLLHEGNKGSQKAILYPTSDEYVLFVSRFRRELSQHFRFTIPSEDLVESIMNKRKQYELAQRTSTPYPKTCYPESETDVERIKDELECPVFVKPCFSHIWAMCAVKN